MVEQVKESNPHSIRLTAFHRWRPTESELHRDVATQQTHFDQSALAQPAAVSVHNVQML